ncbi:hypothetical protein [Pedobacter ginsengisoli]|nr:hypothetical protein [Pedobacter ginsengisoli]
MDNYSQVEALISRLADPGLQRAFPSNKCIKGLEAKIENLSPLLLNSTQWSCFRYALICLRSISKEHHGDPGYI